MKFRMIVITLALTAFSLSQTATSPKANPTQPSTAAASAGTKADCPCCQKTADNKTPESCCTHHQDGTAKSDVACCHGKDGKDAMSCMNRDKDKSAEACCSSGKCGGDGKGCCSKADKTTEQAALACCGANGQQCGGAHHDHGDINK